MNIKKTMISTAIVLGGGLALTAHATSTKTLAGTIEKQVGKTVIGAQAKVLDAGCRFTTELKSLIENTVSSGSEADAQATQYGFTQHIGNNAKYGGDTTAGIALTEFINIFPSGAVTSICPDPLQGRVGPVGTDFHYCGHIVESVAYRGPEQETDATYAEMVADDPYTYVFPHANFDAYQNSVRYSGIRFYGPLDTTSSKRYLPIEPDQGALFPDGMIAGDNFPISSHLDDGSSTMICASSDTSSDGLGCMTSDSVTNGLIANTAAYSIFQVTADTKRATSIDSIMWLIEWEFMNNHVGTDQQNARFVTGSFDVYPISDIGGTSKAFNAVVVSSAPKCDPYAQ